MASQVAWLNILVNARWKPRIGLINGNPLSSGLRRIVRSNVQPTTYPKTAYLSEALVTPFQGITTGCLYDERGNWDALLAVASSISSSTVELSALSYPELPPLLDYLESGFRQGQNRFSEVSVHAPTKSLPVSDTEICELLIRLPRYVTRIIAHPDVVRDWAPWRSLGSRLVIENMDARKNMGKSVEDLEKVFSKLPDARFCLDLAHVTTIDPSMKLADQLLNAFSDRLAEVHVSSVDASAHHVALRTADEIRFEPFSSRCASVPWIYEALSDGLE